MRLVMFRAGIAPTRCGLWSADGGVIDLMEAYRASLARRGARAASCPAGADLPSTLLEILRRGETALAAARQAEAFARRHPDPAWIFPESAVTILPPIARPGKIIATGWNFASHIEEGGAAVGAAVPSMPTGFIKVGTALVGHEQPVIRPQQVTQLDYEVEFAIVIGKAGRRIPATRALEHVAGFTVMNDVSARDIQVPEMKAGLLLAGKNFDTFAPMGPCLATPDEVDLQTCELRMRVNGEERQRATLRSAVRGVEELLAYWSAVCTLEVGDVITAGSPPGVAMGGHHPFLKAGDIMEAEVTGVGVLRNRVIDEHVREGE